MKMKRKLLALLMSCVLAATAFLVVLKIHTTNPTLTLQLKQKQPLRKNQNQMNLLQHL